MLRCADGSLYTGIAKDLAARLRLHAAGRASRYTRARLPVRLLWSRPFDTWSECLREEHRIKRLRRRDKQALVRGRVPRDVEGAERRESPDVALEQSAVAKTESVLTRLAKLAPDSAGPARRAKRKSATTRARRAVGGRSVSDAAREGSSARPSGKGADRGRPGR